MHVAESQRERLLRAMVREIAEHGYDEVSVAQVVARAGTSRGTFYEEFASKDEALLAAYDSMLDVLIERVRSSFSVGDPWPMKVRLALGVLLRELASNPEIARLATVDIPAAGPIAHERYRQGIERFLPLFRQGREYSGRDDELPEDAELMAVGGAEAIVFDEVTGGRVESLPSLLPDILFTLLVPYLGPEEAVEQMRRARAEGQQG
jgi:AcrR family transcriptional regulator